MNCLVRALFPIRAASKVAGSLGFVALLWALAPATQTAAGVTLGSGCVYLMAGQTMEAGTVCVSGPSGSSLTVTFQTTSSWAMTTVHLDVVGAPSDFPETNSNNPIPGKFPYAYSATYPFSSHTFTVDVSSLSISGGTYYIAAHAVVWNTASEQSVVAVSNTETSIVGASTGPYKNTVPSGPDSGSAALAYQPKAGTYPSCSDQGPGLGTAGLWNQGIGSAYTNIFEPDGAHWIWNYASIIPTAEQISGQIVDFQQTFDVAGTPVGPGTLDIAADNAYEASINGAKIGQARIGPGFPNTLMEDVGSGPQKGSWGVASQGWQTVGSYPFTPSAGTNTLAVTAVNEYQSSGSTTGFPADYYLGWNGSGYTSTIYSDPTPFDTGNGCTNPGGVIFAASVPIYTQSETAWGGAGGTGGTPFPGANWATYFIYPAS